MHLRADSVSLTHFLPPPPPPHRFHFLAPKSCTLRKTSLRCSLSKPLPAEVSRTIMELSSVGTLSTITQDHWPLGVGVRFAVDLEGTPVLCLNQSSSVDSKSSLHVQLEQCGLRRTQCTILGDLGKPDDRMDLKRLHSVWKERFGEDVDEDLIYFIAVKRVLQKEDIMEDGAWVLSSDYRRASPDPLRDFAEKIVNEINAEKMEDVLRFSNIFVDMDFQVSEAKMIWVDRLGFDMRLCFPQKGVFEVRIPFPGEVTDEKGVKSTFNCMSQLAWEREKHYDFPDFEKIKQLKPIAQGVL
ncbi:glutamyl-tRNA reductase-binding protein chloroplastic isoform X1 [Tripterygium wilfordii]|uniref:Glutamyl-tRNA reductase-binding protein chloroplastic isoform X1 n=1 Tax=Tripterygium wilfordii TaxID=458696 RepID=A0A7J7D5H0_TRIWF|nr:glutamyl-tRNA reductase-binding protein, chloroplastic [Tripterygium wilfordii]KAF5741605.1 glutamyl-tRNA reductase-binding protein chloroplastic isoform X1 [Tripterygium wilfordii]